MKQCRDCKALLPATAEFFSIDRKKADGLVPRCKSCMSQRWQRYYETNRIMLVERSTARVRNRRRVNPEYDRALARNAKRRQLSNPDEYAAHLARNRDWRLKNAERAKQFKHNKPAMKAFRAQLRYARKKNATPPWADLAAIAEFYIKAAQRSVETGVPHEVDHIIPLSGKNVCGLHVPHNLQIIPAVDNRVKAAKVDPANALAITL